MNRINLEGKKRYMHFESVDDWAEYAKDNLIKDDESLIDYDEHFKGVYTGREMIKRLAARECLERTRKAVHEKSLYLPPLSTEQNEREALTFFNDESGLFLDSNAYFNGDADCMINYDIAETERPVIWIACCYGANCNVSEKQFINRGIALIRTVHALETAGVSIGLVGYSKVGYDGTTCLESSVVKSPSNSLDETTVINLFADKNAFRTIGFATINIGFKKNRATHQTSSQRATVKEFEKSFARGHKIVMLPYDDMEVFRDVDKATDWTLEQVKKQAELTF